MARSHAPFSTMLGMQSLGAYPPMPPVRSRRPPRLHRYGPYLVGALVFVMIVGTCVRFVGFPHRLTAFSSEVATRIGADRDRCPEPATILRYGSYGGYVYFGAVEWYAAVRWNVAAEQDAAHVVNGCLGISVAYTDDTWAGADPAGDGLFGWSRLANDTVPDDAFGSAPQRGSFVQLTEEFAQEYGNQRIVYVSRTSAGWAVDLYMFNWD